MVGAASGMTSRAPNSPKDSRKADDDDDDDDEDSSDEDEEDSDSDWE